MANIPVAIQLFSVRGEVQKDLAATLKNVAEIGYKGAEPWGYPGDELSWQGHTAQDIRKMYDDNGLKCCGIHLQTKALAENIDRTIEFNKILGNTFLVIAADKGRMSSVDGIKELAGILTRASEKLKGENMFAGYHAHGFDFAEVEGQTAWYRLFDQLPEDVIMQMDTGNCYNGGGDAIEALKKYPGRARSMHLKEYGQPEGGVIGDGKTDWNEVFRLADEGKTEWFVVEEGEKGGEGYEICTKSLEALKKMGRA